MKGNTQIKSNPKKGDHKPPSKTEKGKVLPAKTTAPAANAMDTTPSVVKTATDTSQPNNPPPPNADPAQTIPAQDPTPTTPGAERGWELQAATSAVTTATYAQAAAPPPKKYSVLLLNLRNEFNPYELPTLERVIQAVQLRFPLDEGLVIQQLRGTGAGIYRVILSKPVPATDNKIITLQKGNTIVHITLTEPNATHGAGGDAPRRDGTLITFLNAAVGPETKFQMQQGYGKLWDGCKNYNPPTV